MTMPGYKIGRENGLTRREREVLAGLAEGKAMIDIAAELGVSKQRIGQIAGVLQEKGRVRILADRVEVIVPRQPNS